MPRRKILLEQRKPPSKSESDSGDREIKRRFSLGFWFADVLVLIPVWFILVGTINLPELVVGCVAATTAATVTEVTRSIGFARFYPHLHWFIGVWRVPGQILVDCGILVVVLAERIMRKRKERGFLRKLPFNSGGTGGRSAARRALAITVGTLSPNTCVLDIEPYHNFVLLHQIQAGQSLRFILDVESR
jgi:multisubunit Na+/H+ antiporter MnhE subunit